MKAQGLPMTTIVLIILVIIVLASVAIFFFMQMTSGEESFDAGHSLNECQSRCASISSGADDTSYNTDCNQTYACSACGTVAACS